MKLLCSAPSPYSRMVRILVRYLELDVEELNTNPLENGDTLLSANPLGQIPCLFLNDGSALYDSEVICRYLDATYARSQLFGESGLDWHAQCQFSLLKGLIDSAVKLRQEQMREEEGVRSAFWTSRFEQALLRGIRELERQGAGSSDRINARSIALVCLLDYMDYRHPALEWRNLAPALALWFEEVRELPIFRETRPDKAC
ncbi:glutathione S-transferase [Shewanella litorisediminis]|uniref:Glutathione S-transferase N-terminal domain-containing protein n=1 Tax=Shewanella litorisediminis TaxID=1173586 RepID=A0ABX7G501_9GAMM|nr:glutathione S-transferase N-terminal domain-containing protein [Shewanella litorisediminis]MCL2917993.1 glutathione S-transferase N-terminal domain-containing protein [Shewanella litorisediminis]QRH02426.1 glutathione S-transferase N-terminal domain-containing protein [Shewanella litorisediminis]